MRDSSFISRTKALAGSTGVARASRQPRASGSLVLGARPCGRLVPRQLGARCQSLLMARAILLWLVGATRSAAQPDMLYRPRASNPRQCYDVLRVRKGVE